MVRFFIIQKIYILYRYCRNKIPNEILNYIFLILNNLYPKITVDLYYSVISITLNNQAHFIGDFVSDQKEHYQGYQIDYLYGVGKDAVALFCGEVVACYDSILSKKIKEFNITDIQQIINYYNDIYYVLTKRYIYTIKLDDTSIHNCIDVPFGTINMTHFDNKIYILNENGDFRMLKSENPFPFKVF